MKHQQFVIHWLAFIFISLNLSLPAQSFHISSDLKTTWSTNQNEGVNTINKENIPLPKKDETSLISSQSNYRIPRAAESVTVADIDLDGDNDIVVGHKTAWQATNPTITFLENINNGVLNILDTSNVFCGYQEHIIAADFNNDNFADIVAFMGDLSSGIIERYVRIFYNYNGEFELFQEFPLNTDEVFSDIYWGDINGDYSNDIIVASGNGQIWVYYITMVMEHSCNPNINMLQIIFRIQLLVATLTMITVTILLFAGKVPKFISAILMAFRVRY